MDDGYRLHELGWLGFERLCQAVLQPSGVPRETAWQVVPRRSATATAWDGIRGGGLPELPGPTQLVLGWLVGEDQPRSLDRLARHGSFPPHRSLLVVVSRALPAEAAAELVDRWREELGAPVALLDAAALGAVIDASPPVRLQAPWALGVRSLDGLADAELVSRSHFDVPAAHELAGLYVPTRAHAHAVDVVARHRFAVLTGPPEMGKTAIARMVALAQLSAGWEVHECIRPDELWAAYDRDRPQVFVADDAFGSTEYRADAAERWALELPRVLHAMDERHWLLWTSRPTPLRAGLRLIHREHGTERFPQPAQVRVDAGALDVAEKALILYRHARARRLSPSMVAGVRTHGYAIVAHPDYTPERIRRLTAVRLAELVEADVAHVGRLRDLIDAELREPTPAMSASYHALAPEQQALLLAMLDSPPGPVPERDLARAARRHAGGPLQQSPVELVDRLADHFVRPVPPASVAWVHPSWRDLLIDELASHAAARRSFLGCCGLEGALLALSVGGGARGERRLPLLRADADWDALTDRLARLLPELDDVDQTRLLQALRAALTDLRAGEHDAAELEALAVTLLEATRRAWDGDARVLPAILLGAWLQLAGTAAQRVERPELGRSLVELSPPLPLETASAADLQRLDEFLWLCVVLAEHAPEVLRSVGFAHRYGFALRWLVTEPPAGLLEGADPALGRRILARIARLRPDLADEVDALASPLQARYEEGWNDPGPPGRAVDPATVADRQLVNAVLDDLDP